MTNIQIAPKLVDKLNRLAKREQKTVDEVLERLLEPENVDDDDQAPGGLALLQAIREANIHSGKTDTAERSREILENEFPKYLKSRMDNQAHKGFKE